MTAAGRLTRRRLLTAALAAGAAVGLGRDTARLRTVFEESNGQSWTSLEDEARFLTRVERSAANVGIKRIGTTVSGMPLRLVRLGPAKGPGLLVLATQHGNEPAGREATLQLVRDLAFTVDPVLRRQLRAHRILVVPTANPDGVAAWTRGNARGADLNRDHLNLREPETRALAAVLRDERPDVVVDLHEYAPVVPGLYDDDVLSLWPRNRNVDPGVHALARALCLDYLTPGARASGFSAGVYGQHTAGGRVTAQVGGSGDEGMCRNTAGLHHRVAVVAETPLHPHVGEPGYRPFPRRRRVAVHRRILDDCMHFLRDQAGPVARNGLQAAAAARYPQPIAFSGSDVDAPPTNEVADPPPWGYRLTADQASTVAEVLPLHGIRSVSSPDGTVTVPSAQPARVLAALLLDARGDRHAVTGEPLAAPV
ncbi:MAG: succinylglutamate desuccinylase/aspartoacylase family protein [Actinomycetota bacterium]|nr:succinylglutamate desuccinylase/aspartoacylase family protein [Actinomycetota bacterium]